MKEKVQALIDALKNGDSGVEAVVLFQNGEYVLEHRFIPPNERAIHSQTKSFVATAAGIAIDEGKLSLDTRILDLFPEYESIITDERVKALNLEHFLKMSSGFGSGFIMQDERRKGVAYPDYMKYLLSKPLVNEPGTKFCYSNADSHMIACMIERAVGEPLMIYCYDKIFSKLGIVYPVWETDPKGTPFGGSGLYLDVIDMMKLGVLYLNKGKWNGEQIVSENWVNLATQKQIDTDWDGDWSKGYGYQLWTLENHSGAFRFDGAYCQYSVVLPDENAVLATQCSEYQEAWKVRQAIIEHILNK
ncbi:MAG: serine hydrolase [Ruminococcaceae bacterium]|nr:serine hydrolase [Oscillospiraceae bacterium]